MLYAKLYILLKVRWALSAVVILDYTMRRDLLNCCNLVSISKNIVFYVFGVVRIYWYLADLLQIIQNFSLKYLKFC